ncbi:MULTISPECIES: L,D-transpeptidase family protein [Clostridium]|uniref:Lipoprotein-anchoring transpeptidase ErfK/SrfK n=3 Tax=Clostridium TaxID=1485 RepID=A0A1S9NCX7_CLOBE|nr:MULTISPECIES: L,D-transpeptidase family protein [Clostridium]MBN7577163.1 L,D-transpeptidase/peptidoglycan binding protein [Clostridium beijerinckii]MBN7582042.1 L,D-transpeptidase/peptidoglycan binding protein [Clostridium beijerinckii]MBN7586929.1 L,D-transpeptidase/peptidoglycan binding protein [Clostridium beijerinckii]MBO0523132.1 L,D-transpeptidase/peptidoglycan binding protein [Clostridium beijerinckii]MZK50370.1 L,D-transpeptidase family protein [Clostridium beijerinckii]
MRKRRNKSSNKVMPGVIISLCTLGAIYLGMSLYSINHFHFGTVIDGVNVGGQTVEGAEEKLAAQMQSYALELDERGDVKEQIKASDIGLKYNSDKIKELKNNQSSFAWPSTFFKKNNSEASQIIMYDEEQLNQTLNKLSCVSNKKITQPQNASLNYKDGEYEIVDEVLGNKINKDALHDNVANAILDGKTSIDLDSSNCYENPKYTSKSEEVTAARDTLNKYIGLKITYDSNGKKEVLDGSTIHNWLGVDDNMQVTINEDKVRNYVYKISSIYNTFGSTRDFVTTTKKTVQVSGGNYGWIVDNSKEVKDLIEIIKNGQDVTKEPKYAQNAFVKGTNDIGNTYVEVNITKQHVWFYKNGALVVDDDVVTGNVSNNTGTPVGTYVLNYKEKNATLKGEDYSSPVDYWMPFNGNVGIHDASWRNGVFGKQIYLTSGSHGCVNSPYNLAKTIFENIEPGTPIIVYTE